MFLVLVYLLYLFGDCLGLLRRAGRRQHVLYHVRDLFRCHHAILLRA